MSKVVIVEDSPSQAAIIAQLVKGLGFEVATFTEVSKSLVPSIVALNPQFLLLDLNLLGADGKPLADGFQVCKEIKRLKATIKVIIITSNDDEASVEWATLQGADGYVKKPFSAVDLKAAIDRS
jgi:DNA-binding response OmpR family regulator